MKLVKERGNLLGMSIDVLGDRVDDDIGTQREWVLEVGTHKSIVDNQLGIVLVRDLSNGSDIDQTQGGIGRSLNPDELGVRADSGGKIGGILEVNKGDLDTHGRGDLCEIAVGASVDIVHRDDM